MSDTAPTTAPTVDQFTPEQRALQDSLRRFFRETLPSDVLRRRIASPLAADAELWKKLDALGLFEYFATPDESSAPGVRDLALIAYECGYALCPEPLVEALLAGPYLERLVTADCAATVSADAVGGAVRAALACASPGATGDCRFDGIRGGTAAGKLLLLMRVSGEWRARWHAVSEIRSAMSLDLSMSYGALFLSAQAAAKGEADLPAPIAALLAEITAIALAMEVAGVVARTIEMTVEYVKTRRQFDVPVGGFQAVQHRLADMHLKAESLRALSQFAAWAADAAPEQRALTSRAAIVQACRDGATIVEGAIQLHGGIGFTWEHDLHLYLRRVKTIEILYRDLYPADELLRYID